MGFAAAGTMARLTTDAATVEVGTSASEMTGGVLCPSETEVLAIGSEHGMLALGIGSNHGCWFAGSSLVCLAFGWKMVRAATPKAISSLALLRGLR
jgi:hypothetical protein